MTQEESRSTTKPKAAFSSSSMRVADLDIPAVFVFRQRRWISSRAHTQADTMRWCLDLDGGQLLQLPMSAEVTLLDTVEAATILAAHHDHDVHQQR